jgi:hypothetical protein
MENAAEGVVAPSVVTDETPTDVTPVEQSEESAAPETQESEPQDKSDRESKEPPKWTIKRINEVTGQKYKAIARAEAAEARAAEYERRLQALESGQPAESYTQQPQGSQPTHDQILRQAESRVAFDMKCNEAFKAGTKEFDDFEDALSNLKMVGIDANALGVIVEADEPHKVLRYLGQDPDEATRILSLNPVAMARAIGALEVRLSQPKPTPAQSKAPAPISPVSARSASSTGLGDELSMAEWIKRRNAQVHGK